MEGEPPAALRTRPSLMKTARWLRRAHRSASFDLDAFVVAVDYYGLRPCTRPHGRRLHVRPAQVARSRCTIALDPETVRVLAEHLEVQLAERAFAGEAYVDGDLVFADELGGRIHPHRLTSWFGGLRKAAAISTGTLHTLRHTVATLALTEGVPVHMVAARLGDDPNTVLSTYAHLLSQSDELAVERVAALLAG